VNTVKKIALDFDNVLSDTMVAWTSKYNEKHKTNFSKDHIETWDFWNQPEFQCTKSYADTFFRQSWEDWKNLPATEPSLDKTVARLAEHGEIYVVTNIEKNYLGNVNHWLEDQNISVKDVVHSGGRDKLNLEYDLFIDDDPDLANNAHTNGQRCFIYHQKWNKKVKESQHVSRISKLTETINHIAEKEL